jgi:bifunctional UDP-N-acetylglucosamine pyrophosphorylase / glucosamine-1-phosphate N-acetyltransferase
MARCANVDGNVAPLEHGAIRDASLCRRTGRGTRLGSKLPKLLAPLDRGTTAWNVLSRKLLAIADHVSLIVSPTGLAPMSEVINREGLADRVSLSVQSSPTGMGDAIFCAAPIWSQATTILIVWGDQVFVSDDTLRQADALHKDDPRTVVFPLVTMARPYVEYCFDQSGGLAAIKQQREGDQCTPHGYADIGTFMLSVKGLEACWRKYREVSSVGILTHEINFLPFLPWLAARGWKVRRFAVADEREARGINTPEDLAFLQTLISAQGGQEEMLDE